MIAVAEMREKKSAEEVEEMERAFHIGYAMHTPAMTMCRPGVVEREIAGAIEGVAKAFGRGVSFPSIVSQHGETLHNLNADGVLEKGVCCCATRAAKRSTTTAPTTPVPTP